MPGVALSDLDGTRALITGANSGVGLEIARALAGAGAEILRPVRSRARGERAIASIRANTSHARIELDDLDLSRLASVRALATSLVERQHPLDHLVLNAGFVGLGDAQRHVSDDGFERHFQTNFLGHVALTLGLLPLLCAHGTRVIVQCSLAAAFFRIDTSDLQLERRYAPLRAYGRSKAALGLFAYELARRHPELTVHLCHPGIVPGTQIAPEIRRRFPPRVRDSVSAHLGNTPAQSAEPALLALTTDAAAPGFFAPSGVLQFGGPARPRRPFRSLTDAAAGAQLWEIAATLVAE